MWYLLIFLNIKDFADDKYFTFVSSKKLKEIQSVERDYRYTAIAYGNLNSYRQKKY